MALGDNIENIALDDFTGGWIPRLSASHFSERQWAKMYGLVLEDNTRMRSQWALQQISTTTGFDEIGYVDGRLVARKSDGTFWWTSNPNSQLTSTDTQSKTWTEITGIPANTSLHIICQVPIGRDDTTVGYNQALLINGRDRGDVSAWAVYFPGGGASLREFSARWPSESGDTMPPANKGVMWGDSLVLGDIRWLDDEDSTLSDTNHRTHPSAVWFSAGGKLTEWDVLDTVWATFAFSPGGSEVRSMVPIDAGLLVFTGAGIALLRGDPSHFEFEPLRTGLSCRGPAAFWPELGSAAWIDNAGQVWHTNSEDFSRLTDVGLDLERTSGEDDDVCPLGEYLLYAHQGSLYCLKSMEYEGVWTELIPPTSGGVYAFKQIGDQAVMLDSGGAVFRFNRRDTLDDNGTTVSERGQIDGVDVEPRVATRTMTRGGGHRSQMWHRAGIRTDGTGTVKKAVLRPGPALDASQNTMEVALNESASDRYDKVVRAHGPSVEASVEWVLAGDVTVEQVEWWVHRGRGER